MKTNFIKAFAGIGLAITVMASGQPFVASALIPQASAAGAVFNASPQDFPVLEVANETRCPATNGCWSSSTTAAPGDTIAFVMYVHNTGDEDALNTKLALSLTQNGGTMSGYGRITADNASPVSKVATVSFSNNGTPVTLTYTGGEYYRQSSLDPTGPDQLPNGQTVRQLSSGGVNLGSLPADYPGSYENDAQIVIRYRVNGGDTCTANPSLNVTPDSQTVNVGETAQYRAIYDSNGPNCSGGTTDVTDSAQWTSGEVASVAESLGQGRFRGTREGTGSVTAYYNNLSDSATIQVRGNNGGNATLVIVPPSLTINVGNTASYRALYDADGPSGNQGEVDVTGSSAWSANSTAIATSFGNGQFRGNATGNTGVRATYGSLSATASLNVRDGNVCNSGATLKVTPTRDTIDVGDEAQFRATYDSNGDCAGGTSDVTDDADWEVDSTTIATNLGDGEFRGRRDGSTTVRARYSGLTDTASLRVRDDNDDDDDSCDDERATLVIIPFNTTISVGQTYQYRALYDEDGPGCSDNGDRDVTGSASWSSNSGVASSFGNGQFRGNAAGTAPITARYQGVTANAQLSVVSTGGPIIQQPPVIQQPPIIIGGGGGGVIAQPIVAGVSDTSSVACITVTPSVDVNTMLPNQEFVYTTLYRNDCPFALNSAVLRVFMPNEVDILASSNPFFIREGQKMSYNLGTLVPGAQGSVAITGFVHKDAKLGDTLMYTSTIEFLDSTNRIQNASSYLAAILGGKITRSFSANITETLGAIFSSGLFWLLIILFILLGIAWFLWSMLATRRNGAAATTNVVVAKDQDPLSALRNA